MMYHIPSIDLEYLPLSTNRVRRTKMEVEDDVEYFVYCTGRSSDVACDRLCGAESYLVCAEHQILIVVLVVSEYEYIIMLEYS